MKILKSIKYEINSLLNSYDFWKAKRSANKQHKLTGKRYHVIPSGNKLVVVNNEFVKYYNKQVKKKAKKITIHDLLKMSYYSTPVQGITRKSKKVKTPKSLIKQIFQLQN